MGFQLYFKGELSDPDYPFFLSTASCNECLPDRICKIALPMCSFDRFLTVLLNFFDRSMKSFLKLVSRLLVLPSS